MTPMILHARHYATDRPIALGIEGGRIVSAAPSSREPQEYVAPSFFDPQINGCKGIGFNSPELTVEKVEQVVDECRAHGVGGLLPTVITDSFESIHRGFTTLSQAIASSAKVRAAVPGFHLEGPYIASEDGPRGAHPRQHARDPDWDEFRRWQDAAEGRIRMVTVAPERAGMTAFIEKLAAAGVVAALGHTAARPEQIRAAAAAGARTSTHLGNGCHAMLPRHENVIWEQLANDSLWASLITDGHHLPPAVVKCLVRAKGVGRVLLTSDAGSLAGMPPGRYREWGSDLEVLPGGKIVVAGTPYLAGSGHFTDRCVAGVMRDAGVSLAEAVDMASARPRELLGLPVPAIEPGAAAGLVVFLRSEDGLQVVAVL